MLLNRFCWVIKKSFCSPFMSEFKDKIKLLFFFWNYNSITAQKVKKLILILSSSLDFFQWWWKFSSNIFYDVFEFFFFVKVIARPQKSIELPSFKEFNFLWVFMRFHYCCHADKTIESFFRNNTSTWFTWHVYFQSIHIQFFIFVHFSSLRLFTCQIIVDIHTQQDKFIRFKC